jgi:hypothetical protein
VLAVLLVNARGGVGVDEGGLVEVPEDQVAGAVGNNDLRAAVVARRDEAEVVKRSRLDDIALELVSLRIQVVTIKK